MFGAVVFSDPHGDIASSTPLSLTQFDACEVVDEHFVDHIIELEKSKSYPGRPLAHSPFECGDRTHAADVCIRRTSHYVSFVHRRHHLYWAAFDRLEHA